MMLKSAPGSPRGIKNPMNQCWVNSSLQCLARIPDCLNYIKSHQDSCKVSRRGGFCCLCALKTIVLQLTDPFGGEPIDTSYFLENIEKLGVGLNAKDQHDAQEFITALFQALTEGADTDKNIFAMQVKTITQCKRCDKIASHQNSQNMIRLQLPKGEACSISKCLDNFSITETLSGRNAYMCQQCEKLVTAERHDSILTTPNVLAVVLSRFDGYQRKDNSHVDFTEKLNFRNYVEDETEDVWFDLCAVLVHKGALVNFGHFISYVKTESGEWYLCNDTCIYRVEFDEVLRQQAYILFYRKLSSFEESVADVQTSSLSGLDYLTNKCTNKRSTSLERYEASLFGEGMQGKASFETLSITDSKASRSEKMMQGINNRTSRSSYFDDIPRNFEMIHIGTDPFMELSMQHLHTDMMEVEPQMIAHKSPGKSKWLYQQEKCKTSDKQLLNSKQHWVEPGMAFFDFKPTFEAVEPKPTTMEKRTVAKNRFGKESSSFAKLAYHYETMQVPAERSYSGDTTDELYSSDGGDDGDGGMIHQ